MFYGFWRPEFLIVMLVSAGSDFFVARQIEVSAVAKHRWRWLLISLCVNLGLLLYFKYLFFVLDNAVATLHFFGYQSLQTPVVDIVLPLGISFYTFQTISYTVDVYRKVIPAEKDIVLYGCFVTFFPQLVAGPILRGGELLGQLMAKPSFKLDLFASGLQRIIFGLFLKVVLADNIAPLVNSGFDQSVSGLSALDVLTLAFLFGFQIYFDFAGYSHIAIGSARLMGISFPENFNFPYMSSSPREFWRRWHISLSSWIRDYLYLPLMGEKVRSQSSDGLAVAASNSVQKGYSPAVALLLTWTIMGFWHGANWTFVLWGLIQGILVVLYRITVPSFASLPLAFRRIGGWMVTLPLVMLAWIPFRAESVDIAIGMYAKLFEANQWTYLGMRENIYLVTAILLLLMIGSYWIHLVVVRRLADRLWLSFFLHTASLGIATSLVFIFLRPINQFIYFQF
jgi:D-alanyl-lipoteichoic acid acyltransferase DltB (MBOAT superfamily)